MDKTNKYDKRRKGIVTNKIILEEITFHGKKIMRERVVKVYNIPDIVTEDIGYELMFGAKPSLSRTGTKSNLQELEINRNLI
jgi:hypothetical protein|tara:strand:- start:1994 stop:2239 length:246 start_codon:yes stop_codon:yes gene_type:complete